MTRLPPACQLWFRVGATRPLLRLRNDESGHAVTRDFHSECPTEVVDRGLRNFLACIGTKFAPVEAHSLGGVVIARHRYRHNVGTTGIPVDQQQTQATVAPLDSVNSKGLRRGCRIHSGVDKYIAWLRYLVEELDAIIGRLGHVLEIKEGWATGANRSVYR